MNPPALTNCQNFDPCGVTDGSKEGFFDVSSRSVFCAEELLGTDVSGVGEGTVFEPTGNSDPAGTGLVSLAGAGLLAGTELLVPEEVSAEPLSALRSRG